MLATKWHTAIFL